MSALTNDTEYLTIIKIAKPLANYHNQFRSMPHLNSLFNQLYNDVAFKAIISIIKSANLSDALAIELLKAQYKSSYSPSSRTDELIKTIDGKDKFSALPDKAFRTLITHIGKKFNFNGINITNLHTIENGYTPKRDRHNKISDTLITDLYQAFKDKSNIQYMPKKTRELLQPMHNEMLKAGMKTYIDDIAKVSFSSSVKNKLPDYTSLLLQIEQGNKPSKDDLETLASLYHELKKHNKLDAMPNRSQAFLENYQLEQDLKKKAPLNAQKLLEKLKRGETLGVFQAFYLMSHLEEKRSKSANSNVPEIHASITHILQKLPQDVRNKAAEIKNLDKSSLLESFDKIIEQIRAEQGRASNRRFYVKELGVYIQLTHNFMEIRIAGENHEVKDKKEIKQVIQDSKGKDLAEIMKNLQKLRVIYHRGPDFTGRYLKSDGTVRYIKDSEINPTISKVLSIAPTKTRSKKTRDITILEYNENTDRMVLTTFRHLQIGKYSTTSKLAVEQGAILKNGDEVGTATFKTDLGLKLEELKDKPKEHTHLEKSIVDIAEIRKMLNIDNKKTISDKITTYINEHIAAKLKERRHGKFKESEFIKAINPMSNIGEKDFVGLFAPSSNIANQIRTYAKKDWDERASNIIKANNAQTVDEIYKAIYDATFHDTLTLKGMVDVLLRMKLMLETVGEKTEFLNKTIQKAQKTMLDLEDTLKPRPAKVKD